MYAGVLKILPSKKAFSASTDQSTASVISPRKESTQKCDSSFLFDFWKP